MAHEYIALCKLWILDFSWLDTLVVLIGIIVPQSILVLVSKFLWLVLVLITKIEKRQF